MSFGTLNAEPGRSFVGVVHQCKDGGHLIVARGADALLAWLCSKKATVITACNYAVCNYSLIYYSSLAQDYM